ncbi:hybrid sensor histidine kinase/response regulator [Variovorax ginsengisoli]|uniref:histidine kinase n=1 Tax=Variovorax ginsengisoli TaxID=363844 RepID=A0ABT9SE50_9BURK|nr:hybrid sensor histidine kinase/response regulator [Variovorax ginsengisoli]MDP9902164.1 two-component system sensor histidine kinase and response regulator WspE [Variovorax ginsengisoli]
MNPDEIRDASLLELFQMEAVTQVQVLNDGLLALERDPRAAAHLESCMRAAHSLKGAGRIVDLEPAVRIAHAMEDCLVSAQEGRLLLQPSDIDALLMGADLLLRVATPGVDLEADIAQLQARLSAAPVARTRAEASAPAPAPQPAAPVAASAAAAADDERVLRVTADTLNRLLGLSSETLVEAHRLEPLNAAMLRLKRQQSEAARALETLREQLAVQQPPPDARVQATLDHAVQLMGDCAQTLGRRMDELDQFGWRMTHLSQRLYDTALACRMRPFGDGIGPMARSVRDLARALGKQVRLDVEGDATQVDRDILEKLEAPLTHLLRNALDHGIESPADRQAAGKPAEGVVRLQARHSAGMLVIEIGDDGRGIDLVQLREEVVRRELSTAPTVARLSEAELLEFLFLPGFSTRTAVTEISGRGVGLDVVQNMVRQLRGSVRVHQKTGVGMRFVLEMPLSLSVMRSLLVDIGGEHYAFPLAYVTHALEVPHTAIEQLEGHQHLRFQGRQISLVSARQLLQYGNAMQTPDPASVVVIGEHGSMYGVAVDRFIGERTVVVQPLDPRLGKVRDIQAGALMEDGAPLLILDVEDLLLSIGKLVADGRLARVDASGSGSVAGVTRRQRVLVVDDSLTVRELERKLLTQRGYQVAVAVDGMDGWNMFRAEPFDLVVTDVDMPRMDGIELVTRIKRDPRLQNVPVIVVSYKDREEDRQRGLDAGADYYLAKSSFHDEALLEAVEDLIGRAHT